MSNSWCFSSNSYCGISHSVGPVVYSYLTTLKRMAICCEVFYVGVWSQTKWFQQRESLCTRCLPTRLHKSLSTTCEWWWCLITVIPPKIKCIKLKFIAILQKHKKLSRRGLIQYCERKIDLSCTEVSYHFSQEEVEVFMTYTAALHQGAIEPLPFREPFNLAWSVA